MTYYNDTFLSSPVKQALGIIAKGFEEGPPDDAPQVPDDIRKGFNSARLRWVRLLQDFEMFCSRMSKELGQYRVQIDNNWQSFDYLNTYQFESPEELPGSVSTEF